MTIKCSDKVTITLDRTTVAMLRARKRGLETWDELMQRLGERMRYGAECMICGTFVRAKNKDESPNEVAVRSGWEAVYSGKISASGDGVETKVERGYMCRSCWENSDK